MFRLPTASKATGAGLLMLVLLASSGCQKRVVVTGKVLDKGQPLASAELRWVGQSDDSVFASGVTDVSGQYILDSAGKKDIPVGRYEVTVTWWRMRDGKPVPEGEEGTAAKAKRSARQFAATLMVDITSNTTTLDLDITGKGAPVEDEDNVPVAR